MLNNMQSVRLAILAFFLTTTSVIGEAGPDPHFPHYRSAWLAKMTLTNKSLSQPEKSSLFDKSNAEKTASLLNLLAVPALIGGLLTRKEKALSIVLLSASIGLNVSAIYLRLHHGRPVQRQATNSLVSPLNPAE